MKLDTIIDAANRAYHTGRIDEWRMWHSLIIILGLMAPDSRLIAVTLLHKDIHAS